MTKNKETKNSEKIQEFLSLSGLTEKEILKALNVSNFDTISISDIFKAISDKRIPLMFNGDKVSFKIEVVNFHFLEDSYYFLIILAQKIEEGKELEEPYFLDVRIEPYYTLEDDHFLEALRTLKEMLLSGEICGSSQISLSKSGPIISDFFPEFKI